MKNLEEALKACHKPDIRVPEFRDDLQREIRARIEMKSRMTLPWYIPACFVGLTAVVVLFAGLLTWFIVNPDVSRKVSRWVGNQSTEKAEPVEYQSGEYQTRTPIPLDLQAVFSPENDKQFAQQWVKQNYPQITSQVTHVENEKIVTLRWIRLENGQKLLVMSEFDPNSPKQQKVKDQNSYGGIL